MLKVSYISDLHLDFWCKFTSNQLKWRKRTEKFTLNLINTDEGEKDVICIAGDISHFNNQSYWFIDILSQHYNQVLVTYGNHDYYLISKNQESKYKGHSKNRVDELTEMLITLENVHVFTNENYTFKYKNVKFGGLTMWYPLKTPEQQMFFYNVSNDSQLIKKFSVSIAHDEDRETYSKILQEDVDVMISHVPVINIDSHFKYNSIACYLTPLKNIQVSHWIFGHSHEQQIYEKPYCTFYMNCLGYPSDKLENMKIKSFTMGKMNEC